jgi:hypothetical protein
LYSNSVTSWFYFCMPLVCSAQLLYSLDGLLCMWRGGKNNNGRNSNMQRFAASVVLS